MKPLRLLVMCDTCAWVAMCLEHWVATQGSTPDEALEQFGDIWCAQSDLDTRPDAAREFPACVIPAPDDAPPARSYYKRHDALPPGREWHCFEYGPDRVLRDRVFEVRVEPKL